MAQQTVQGMNLAAGLFKKSPTTCRIIPGLGYVVKATMVIGFVSPIAGVGMFPFHSWPFFLAYKWGSLITYIHWEPILQLEVATQRIPKPPKIVLWQHTASIACNKSTKVQNTKVNIYDLKKTQIQIKKMVSDK